jgi:hypothetical protein
MLTTGVTNGGDTIKPGVGFHYISMFKAASATCCNQGPSGYTVPTGGSVFGPLAWTSHNDTASSYDRMYAVFTDSFSFQSGLPVAAHSGLAVQMGIHPNPS